MATFKKKPKPPKFDPWAEAVDWEKVPLKRVNPPVYVRTDTLCTTCEHRYGSHTYGIAGPCQWSADCLCKAFQMAPKVPDDEAELWD